MKRLRQLLDVTVLNPALIRGTLFVLAAAGVVRLAQALLAETALGAVSGWIGTLPLWLQILIGLVFAATVTAGWLITRRTPSPDPAPRLDGLPPVPSDLVGRDADVDVVTEALNRHGKVAVVGRRGVGTSTVAVHAADRVAKRFTEPAVYLDLRGLVGHPAHTPESALHMLMGRLGLAEPRSLAKRDIDDAALRLQEWYAEHKTVVMLNNVDDPRQVERLLPLTGGSVVVLAGSFDVPESWPMRIRRIGELTEEEAIELLSAVGDRRRVRDDLTSARTLVNRCGRQPLAVRLLGLLMRERPWKLHEFVDEMSKAASRGREHDEEPDSMSGVWLAADIAYHELSPQQRRVFRSLSLVPTIEIGRHAASAVAGLSLERTTSALDGLARRGLIESARPGYYRVRQLLADSADYHLKNEDSPRQQRRARLRLARYYALVAEQFAEPLLFAHTLNDDPPTSLAETEGYRWFRSEHERLQRLITVVGVGDGQDRIKPWIWRLAMGLCTWYAVEGKLDAWQAVCEKVRDMPAPDTIRARLSGSHRMWKTEVRYWAHNELGVIQRRRGRAHRALANFSEALKVANRSRLRSRAQVKTNEGLAHVDNGHLGDAIRDLKEGLKFRGRSDARGQAISVLALGIASLYAERYDVARGHLSHAANQFERLGNRAGQAAALNALGLVLSGQGDRTGIEEHWNLARQHYAAVGDELGEASVLLNQGADLLRHRPDLVETAWTMLDESIRLRQGHPETIYTALTHQRLADACDRMDDETAAAWHRAEARRILDEMD